MRKRVKQTGDKAISVNAVAGTYVVLLGMDATPAACEGLLGFAIHRTDKTEKEQYWLKGFKTFKETNPNPPPGSLVETDKHPVQAFLWGDYTAKPNHDYTYKIVPVYGTPKNLAYGKPVSVNVHTEDEDQGTHAIYFNRGVAGSQAFARKYGSVKLDNTKRAKEQKDVYDWLSRGAEEAMLAFIAQAKDKSYSIRAAVYEFSWMPVLQAFAKASKNGADVKIVYDCRKEEPQKTSKAAIKKAGIGKLMIPRTANKSYISHNKFIVLLKDGKPVQVLGGSTNFTEGGIFGQSNVVHVVRDPKVAAKYLKYWEQLANDAPVKDLAPWNVDFTPNPNGGLKKNSVTPIFSPRTGLDVLNWYANAMDQAAISTGFTAAFGVNKVFADVLAKNKKNFRYVLLEKEGPTFSEFSKNPNNQIAIGAVLNTKAVGDESFHRWLGEKLTALNNFVKYLHTKYLFLDPLGDNPVVISGSANFSDASTVKNDENMMLIQGNKAVADIYLGEFMRLWNHFYFRDIANRHASSDKRTVDSAHLAANDSWTKPYFGTGSKARERKIFA